MATRRKNNSGNKNGSRTKSGSRRKSPGEGGQGAYYHIEVRSGDDFATFRTQDVGDTQEAKDLLRKLRTKPVHREGDVFESQPRRNVPERSKPTAAQRKARSQNIKKAQIAKRRGR